MTLTHDSIHAISRLPVPTKQDLTGRLRRQSDALEAELGYVPNWLRAWSFGGDNAARLIDYLLPLLSPTQGELPYQDRELLATVTSAENGCSYCRLNHIQTFGAALGDRPLATRVALNYREVPELSQRQRALADFAVKVSHHVHDLTDADFQDLRDIGLTDEEIFEAILVVTVFDAGNRLSIALNVKPDDQFFE